MQRVGIYTGYTVKGVFRGNIIRNVGLSGTTPYAFMLRHTYNCLFVNNVIIDDQDTPTTQYGFYEDTDVDNNFFINNKFINIANKYRIVGANSQYIDSDTSSLKLTNDLEFINSSKGVILIDRTTGDKYRLYVDNGTLNIEAL